MSLFKLLNNIPASTCLAAVIISISSTLTLAAQADDGSLTKRATINCEKAESIALEKYAGATVKEIKLDGDDLPLVWDIELRQDKWHIHMEIDAKSGDIVRNDKHK